MGTVLLTHAGKPVKGGPLRTVVIPALGTLCSQHPLLFISSMARTKDTEVDTAHSLLSKQDAPLKGVMEHNSPSFCPLGPF